MHSSHQGLSQRDRKFEWPAYGIFLQSTEQKRSALDTGDCWANRDVLFPSLEQPFPIPDWASSPTSEKRSLWSQSLRSLKSQKFWVSPIQVRSDRGLPHLHPLAGSSSSQCSPRLLEGLSLVLLMAQPTPLSPSEANILSFLPSSHLSLVSGLCNTKWWQEKRKLLELQLYHFLSLYTNSWSPVSTFVLHTDFSSCDAQA